jgi:hypothetical protein
LQYCGMIDILESESVFHPLNGPALSARGSARMEFGADCVSVWLRRPDFEDADRAMSEMLIQGTSTYKWNPRSPRIRFDAEFLEATKVRVHQSLAEHICEVQR